MATLKIQIRVKPRSSRESIEQLPDGSLIVRVNAPPVEGKANERIVQLLADHFSVAKSNVRISVGTHGRTKIVEIMK